MHQIQVTTTFDVEAIERELVTLWKDSATEQANEEPAVLRARVANLLILTANETGLDEINSTLDDLSAVHPCRALVIVAAKQAADQDIQLYVSSLYKRAGSGGRRLSCEEVVLIARGKFVSELPSAALQLLVPDLPTFVWWRTALDLDDRTFLNFSDAANRLVIDTAESENSWATLLAVAQLFSEERHQDLGISDINWARLTSWRALLANFYDAPRCKAAFTRISSVVIDYSMPGNDESKIAPQALLFAAWLASRLEWKLVMNPPQKNLNGMQFEFFHENRRIRLDLTAVERTDMRPGSLARAQLTAENDDASFVVTRDQKGLHLQTHAIIAGVVQPGRVLPIRNRSTAQLIGRELEILCNDHIYIEAVRLAAKMIELCSPGSL